MFPFIYKDFYNELSHGDFVTRLVDSNPSPAVYLLYDLG